MCSRLRGPEHRTYLLVRFAIELAVDDADDADGVLCVDCITLLDELLLVAVCGLPREFGECGPEEMGLFFHG